MFTPETVLSPLVNVEKPESVLSRQELHHPQSFVYLNLLLVTPLDCDTLNVLTLSFCEVDKAKSPSPLDVIVSPSTKPPLTSCRYSENLNYHRIHKYL